MQKRPYSKNVSIVIVTHNSANVIGKCLESIPDGIKTYVVDNASSDDTKKIVKKFPKVTLIESDNNVGFGCANNIALEKIDSEFALLLNPDAVLQADSIENMVAVANNYENAAIVAPMLYYENGELQHSYKLSVFEREKRKSTYIQPSGDLCAESLSGAVMLLRMECFKGKEFFDKNIFLFYEDDDICLQAKKNGYSLVLTPSAKVMHLMGASTPPSLKYIYLKNYHMMWSRLYLERKYIDAASARSIAVKNIYSSAFKAVLYTTILKKDKAIKYLAKTYACIAFVFGR